MERCDEEAFQVGVEGEGEQENAGQKKDKDRVSGEAFAFPLPVTVICELLGVPVADRDQFRAWSATIVSEMVSSEVAQAHLTAMIGYFRDLLAARRREPADDLLSALISARDQGAGLSENELLSMAWLLLVAGHETTANLFGNGLHALMADRAQWGSRYEKVHQFGRFHPG